MHPYVHEGKDSLPDEVWCALVSEHMHHQRMRETLIRGSLTGISHESTRSAILERTPTPLGKPQLDCYIFFVIRQGSLHPLFLGGSTVVQAHGPYNANR